jgi:hypothetical protein
METVEKVTKKKAPKKPLTSDPAPVIETEQVPSSSKAFITANTIGSSLEEIQTQHVIPVFVKDNEPVISHADFIEAALEAVRDIFHGETILKPTVRLSHEIKGRVPEARNKPASELLDHERTIYYERCAFLIEIPSIREDVAGNALSLTVGGVKAYNLDNLYSKKGADEHFKIFIGFKNKVCCNLCVWTDGFVGDLKVKNLSQLLASIKTLFANYNAKGHCESMQALTEYSLTESQFAHLIGRCRMYGFLPPHQKAEITPLELNDTQFTSIVKDYYRNESFCRNERGEINLWRLYNLFTGANKTSYIDTFADRSVNAFDFVSGLRSALEQKEVNWFLN